MSSPVTTPTFAVPPIAPMPHASAELSSDVIPLWDIYADYRWNSRSLVDLTDNAVSHGGVPDVNGTALDGLAASLASVGQDTPVTLRILTPDAQGVRRALNGEIVTQPYELVAGFRRFAAICQLNRDVQADPQGAGRNAVLNVPNHHIRALVRDLDPLGARLSNLRENTGRQALKYWDLCAAIVELKSYQLTGVQLSQALGISQMMVSDLRLVSDLPSVVLAHWRHGNLAPLKTLPATRIWPRISLEGMTLIAKAAIKQKLNAQQIIELYSERVRQYGLNQHPGNKRARLTPTREKEVIEAARFLARFVKVGFLLPGNLRWELVVGPRKGGYPIDTATYDSDACELLQALAKTEFDRVVNGGAI